MSEVKTYRGRELDELLAQIRVELGPDAVIVARREDTEGGVGGFFARRMIELDARPGAVVGVLDVVADEPALPPALLEPVALEVAPAATPEPVALAPEPTFEEHLKSLLASGGPDAVAAEVAVPVEPVAVEPEPEPEPEPEVVDAAPEPIEPVAVDAEPEPVEPVALDTPSAPSDAAEPVASPPVPAVDVVGPDALAVIDALTDMGLSPRVARSILHETAAHFAPFSDGCDLRALVRRALAARIPVHVTRGSGGLVIGVVGAPGSGKTRCAARLAAAYAERSALPVACVALRPADGGVALRDLLAGTDVAVYAEQDAAQAAQRIAELRQSALVVLDTPGVSPRAGDEVAALAADLATVRADELHLVVPATIAPRAARELVEGMRPVHPDAVAVTHQDETDAVGTGVDVAIETDLPLSFIGSGRSARDGLTRADAGELARALMP